MADETMTRLLIEALNPLHRRLHAERTLSSGKLGVLARLERGRATTSELAVIVHVSPQAVSLAARELEQLGYVVRVPDDEDRRRTWLEVTAEGRQKLAQESAAGQTWLGSAIEHTLTAHEREQLEAVIPILYKLGEDASGD